MLSLSFSRLAGLTLLSSVLLVGCDDEGDDVDFGGARDLPAPAPDLARDLSMPNYDMTGFMLVEDCGFTDYVDATGDASARTIAPWDTSLGKVCLRIKAGQTVTWSPAPTSTHPLTPSGGTAPNPITNTATTTFPNPGTYGFQCDRHPTAMFGAIWVDL